MKKILAILGLVLLFLFSILAIRAATVKSRQIQAAPVKDLPVDARAAAERLAGGGRGSRGPLLSMPPPHSAIGKLSEAIEKLEDHPLPARIDGATKRSFEYLAPEMPFGPRLAEWGGWKPGSHAPALRPSRSAAPPGHKCPGYAKTAG